jgi:hypothetical protein
MKRKKAETRAEFDDRMAAMKTAAAAARRYLPAAWADAHAVGVDSWSGNKADIHRMRSQDWRHQVDRPRPSAPMGEYDGAFEDYSPAMERYEAQRHHRRG